MFLWKNSFYVWKKAKGHLLDFWNCNRASPCSPRECQLSSSSAQGAMGTSTVMLRLCCSPALKIPQGSECPYRKLETNKCDVKGHPGDSGCALSYAPLECEQDCLFSERECMPRFPFLPLNASVLISGWEEDFDIQNHTTSSVRETDVPYDFECGTQDLGLVQALSS